MAVQRKLCGLKRAETTRLALSKTGRRHVDDARGTLQCLGKAFHFLPSLTENLDFSMGCARLASANSFFGPPPGGARKRRRRETDDRKVTRNPISTKRLSHFLGLPAKREKRPGPLRLGTAPRIATALSGAARSRRRVILAPIV